MFRSIIRSLISDLAPSSFNRNLSPKIIGNRLFHISSIQNGHQKPIKIIQDSNDFQSKPMIEKQATTTIARLDQLLVEAKRLLIPEKVVGDHTNYNLRNLIIEEVMVISQILQKLVGTNHSLLEIQKLYENESSSDHFIRGLVVLLISKAGCQDQWTTKLDNNEIYKTQWRLAKIVEMVHMAIIIHKQINNVGFNREDLAEEKINLSNKISVLFGDFLWAKAWKELADMGDIEVIDMMVSVLVNTSEGQFLSEVECTNLANKQLTLDYWLEKNFLLTACLPAFGCKSSLKLAKINEQLQKDAYEFGRNFGFFNKAYQEIKWFSENDGLSSSSSPSESFIHESIDFCSLPVVMYALETGKTFNELMAIKKQNQQDLIKIIRNGSTLNNAKEILNTFRNKSLKYLENFPETEAKDHLKTILKVMDV